MAHKSPDLHNVAAVAPPKTGGTAEYLAARYSEWSALPADTMVAVSAGELATLCRHGLDKVDLMAERTRTLGWSRGSRRPPSVFGSGPDVA